jgi:tetratricopeptide (TPR) repeat protein
MAPKMTTGRKIVMSMVVVVVFFLLLEGLLALFGVRAASYADDPYVGFSSTSPLFVESRVAGDAGEMATAENKLSLFNPQRFPVPKGDVVRVFCVGGSTTFGRPYDDATSFCGWLRELLPVADPSRSWEVVNAGGVSYASYRVALLMEELIEYEPDIFVVYSGHNEFLERRTYPQIIAMPRAVRGLGSVASRTRIWTAMSTAVRQVSKRSSAPESNPDILEEEVTTLLDTAVGPSAYDRDDALAEKILQHYRFNLTRMVDIADSVGAETIFITPASNLRNSRPFKSEHRPDLSEEDRRTIEDHLARAQEAHAEGRLAESLAETSAAASLDPRHAQLAYLHGRILEESDDWAGARLAFERARDEDVCPLRAPGPVSGIAREVAVHNGALLVDFEVLADGWAEHGIPGDESFLDHVHPTISVHRRLAVAILETMADGHLLRLSPGWGDEAVAEVADRVEAGLDPQTHALALMKLSKVLGWAGKVQESYRLAAQAVELYPEDSRIQYNAGLTAHLVGRKDEAIARYRRAVELQPDADEPHGNLGVLLEESGRIDDAIHHFRMGIRFARTTETANRNSRNLARALMLSGYQDYSRGEFEPALAKLTEAAEIVPGSPEILGRLGIAQLSAGMTGAAVATFESALAVRGDDAALMNRLALALALDGQTDRAASIYARATDLDPGVADFPDNLYRVLSNMGKIELANTIRARVGEPRATQ